MKTLFASNIHLLRNRTNKTQDMVARSTGISRSTINSMENGAVINPSLDKLIKFSDYYKIPIDDLVKRDLSKMKQFDIHILTLNYTKSNAVASSVNNQKALATN